MLLVWGPLMVGGGFYVVSGQWSWLVAVVSIAYALGPTSVLFGKHLDKRAADAAKGVRTLPVILGEARARSWVKAMTLAQYCIPSVLVFSGQLPWPILLIALAFRSAYALWRACSYPLPLGEGLVVVMTSSMRPYAFASSGDMKLSRSVSAAIRSTS